MELNRLRKKNITQLFLLLIGLLLIFLIYFSNPNKKNNTEKSISNSKQTEGPNKVDENLNFFENLEYKGVDNNGNRFVIYADYSNFSKDKPEIINMEKMLCYFYFADGTTLEVRSGFGTYNNVSLDISFAENVNMFYVENTLFSDKADFVNSDNTLFVEGNVRTQSPNGEVFADKLNFDFNDKKLKISMYENNEKVNVKTKIK
tara:strand:+ start:1587 stop:2195 length:609 start_codon:yes stop_codon:yes gene_type:complete